MQYDAHSCEFAHPSGGCFQNSYFKAQNVEQHVQMQE
jgi:hypothetical protein